jgi:glycosyltransferase involved in cell wall biosynthesis
MIVLVAPYSPPDREGYAHLGASRKLETIISILSRLDAQIVLINSAHNDNKPVPLSICKSQVGGINVIEITPPISTNRAIGKLKNIFCVSQIVEEIKQLGIPQLIWFYNGYAFEMHMALKAQKTFNVPMILEFEDWHFSRKRGLNPKPYMDYFFWRRAAPFMSGAFVVNELLASKMRYFISEVELLPGIVPKVLAEIAKHSLPFKSNVNKINVGYFGGLSVEKGADIILQLARSLPENYVLHVTGTGPLAPEFEACAKELPERLSYHGRVDDMTLYQLIAKCDVVLNPHSSIENMNNGVFPFKVVEAVASGKLLISTKVPSHRLEDILVGVQFVKHDIDSFQSAIVSSQSYYSQHASLISQGAYVADQRFGEDTLLEKVQRIIKVEECPN